jgi:hypothetical protein
MRKNPEKRYWTNVDQLYHVGDPKAQSSPVAVTWKMLIKQRCHAHFLHLRQQHWQVVNSFCSEDQFFAHSHSLAYSCHTIQNVSEL